MNRSLRFLASHFRTGVSKHWLPIANHPMAKEKLPRSIANLFRFAVHETYFENLNSCVRPVVQSYNTQIKETHHASVVTLTTHILARSLSQLPLNRRSAVTDSWLRTVRHIAMHSECPHSKSQHFLRNPRGVWLR